MKQHIYILILLFATSAFGQVKDRRAELEIEGGVNEISVSPDEKIWLVTAIGNIYYTDNIDSNWHYGKSLIKKKDDYYALNPHLERISFFNKDTAILTGCISSDSKNEYGNNGGYYLTTDAGKNWKLLDHGGNSWIYTIYADREGNAWMGSFSKELYYSNDFGKSWTTKKLPYKSCDRTYSICMSNSINGVAGSDNEIITTDDNWKTASHLETPLDQKKYQTDEFEDHVRKRISKILIWNNHIVVKQNGHIFYSHKDNVDWKSFPIRIIDFEVDNDSRNLFAITDSLKVISFSTPIHFQSLTNEKLINHPIDIKVYDGSLFIISRSYHVYKVNEDGLTKSIPYTTDKKISEPRIVKKGKKLTWGVNGTQIYLSENGFDWYRENALDFSISDFMLQSDSVAILWDGYRNNYRYSLKDHKAKRYFPKSPLKFFLASPAEAFTINSGSRGCFHNTSNIVSYEKLNDSIFATLTLSVNHYSDEEPSKFKNKVNRSSLSKALTNINSNPSEIPLLKDFKITAQDKKNYLSMVDSRLKRKNDDYLDRRKKVNKEFYYSVPSMLDTLDKDIISTILNQREAMFSTTNNWFTVQIVNQNKDTLSISRNYYISSLPWNLPWQIEYNGLNFNSYSVEFSRFIDSCIPEKFMDKGVFDNSLLIMEIADYLWYNEK